MRPELHRLCSLDELEEGTITGGSLPDGHRVAIVDVPDRWVLADRSRMAAWFEHYGTDDLPVIQQVLWPDRFGYFPNDVGSQPGFRKRQPLLRDHPLTYPRLEGRSSGRIRR